MPILSYNGPAEPKPRRRLTTTGAFIAGSILLFVVSLTLNVYRTEGQEPHGWAPSFWLLLFGWLGLFAGIPAWLANPALGVAWLLMGLRRSGLAALALTVASLGFALSFLLPKRIPIDEAGHYARVASYGPAYWTWVASIAVALIGCVVGLRQKAASAADAS
jgi:hypothetical protein